MQASLVGGECLLIEAGDIGEQPLGSGEAAPVEVAWFARRRVERLPVVPLDDADAGLLPFKRELLLGEPGQRGRLPEEVGVDLIEDTAHPGEQIGVGEPSRQELRGRGGVLELDARDVALGDGDLLLDGGQRDLLRTDQDVLHGEALLELPVLLLSFQPGLDRLDLRIQRRGLGQPVEGRAEPREWVAGIG